MFVKKKNPGRLIVEGKGHNKFEMNTKLNSNLDTLCIKFSS